MCLDIGHLRLSKKEDLLLGSKDLKIIKEFHIHGVVGQKDHCVLNGPIMNYIRALSFVTLFLKGLFQTVKHYGTLRYLI